MSILIFLILGLLLVCDFLVLQPKGRVSCADFGSYSDALSAYQQGAQWLDSNHNGIPCENLYKLYKKSV